MFWPERIETVFWLSVMFCPVAEYWTVTESEAQVPVEAQTLTDDVPWAIPVRVKVVPERFACTTLGFEFDET